MADPLFPRPTVAASLAVVATHGGVDVPHDADPAMPIHGVAPLATARPGEVAVADDGHLEDELRATRAGACFVSPAHRDAVPAETVALVTATPRAAFLAVAALIDPETRRPSPWTDGEPRHPSAIVHPSARLEPGVVIGPAVVIGPNVEIGAGTTIGAGVVVERGVLVGRHCAIGAQVTLARALVGDRVVIHAGARIGVVEAGDAGLGRAIVQDGVEIGANAIVMRGAWRDTVVGESAIVAAAARVAGDTLVARQARVSAASQT